MAVRKQRLDKYYNLAKERGYRARSAFKLLELNKKYGFLRDAHIAVDLCAAPGGWMQVLSQEMPPNRKIIGVDLDPIKPLGGDTVSFIGDITTVDCRRTIVGLLDGHQVDVFVHDGAPNFGASKEKDHFVQNDLVLHALKLTTEFLKEGGVFVTKIFRSENFSKIVKVLEQLFGTVDVTKPLSSRNESAEIFAVCRLFKNPGFIDPRLFDSSVLFGDDAVEEEDYKKMLLSDFIRAGDNRVLSRCVKIIPDFECDLITQEFVDMFTDLKVLHPNDMKKIAARKEKILRKIRRGELDIPVLADLVEPARQVAEKEEDVDVFEEIQCKLDRARKKEAKTEKTAEMPKHEFFDDRIFDDFDSTEFSAEDEEAEPSFSCSDSMSMTESEMRCAIFMKEEGTDGFRESTIDRYMVDPDDAALPCERRPVKMDEPRLARKKMEAIGRKKARALRRANKVISDIVVEDEEEEAVVYKKLFRNAYKKERCKLRLAFPSRRGRFRAPKGRGKIMCLDRRMKHDLKIARNRSKR